MIRMALLLIGLSVSPTAYCEPGFFERTDDKIPTEVRKSTASVFKLIVPDGTMRIVDISTATQETDRFTKAQLDFCRNNAVASCPVFDQVSECSAFVSEKSTEIYTALHCVVQYLRMNASSAKDEWELARLISRTPIPIYLINANQKMIYPTENASGAQIVQSAVALKIILDKTLSTVAFGSNDIVKLALRTAVGPPLKLSSEPIQTGSTVYAIGFPSETHNRLKDFGAPDSAGRSLYITRGEALDVQKSQSLIGEKPEVLDFTESKVFYSNADGEHGMSGGLFCDGTGRIVGIYTRQQTSALDDKTPITSGVRFTYFTHFPDIRRFGFP